MNDQRTKQLTTALLANGLALAASAQSTTNEPAKLPDVVVKGQQEQTEPYKPERVQSPRYTEPLRDVPQTITVVPRAVMEQQGATTLRDVLRNVPGISFQAGEGGVPSGDNLSIRGFSARTDMFVDNVRDFGGYARDPFNFEQVEVAKGPSSSQAGRGSTGGSINLVSKAPQLDRFYGGSFGVGTEDYKRMTLDFNQPITKSPIPGTAVRLNAMYNEAGVANRDVVNNERWGIAPSVAFGLGTPTRLTLSYFHLSQDNIPDYGIPWVPTNSGPLAAYGNKPAPVDYNNFYGLKDRDFETTRTDIPSALLEHDINESFSLRNLTRFGRTDRDSVITAPRFANLNTTPTITRQLQSRDQTDTIFANQTDFTSRFDTWKFGHTLVATVDYSHEKEENFARTQVPANATPVANVFNPDPSQPFNGDIRRTGAYVQAKSDSVGLSLFDTIKFDDHWQLSGGVRWDHFETDYKSVGTNGARLAGTPISRSDEMFSWRSALTYKPVQQGSIYVAYGTSFNPSAEGLSLSTNATAASSFDLDPEESRTFEVGTKWDLFENKASVSLAVFRTEKTNARTEDPADTSDILVLDGEQRVDGIEIGAAGRLTEKWQVYGGYAYLVSEITKSNNPREKGQELSNTPKNTFTVWTTYDLPWHLQIGGGAQYTDSRYSINTEVNRREAPSYWLFDGMVGWTPNEHFSLRLNVYNLADEEYIDRVGGGHFVPGAGRSAVLTASLKF